MRRKVKGNWVSLDLLAVQTVQQKTGRVIDLIDFMAQFVTGLVSGNIFARSPCITNETTPDELPSLLAGTTQHTDPGEARENFAMGMGNLFGDEDDDFGDD